MLQIFEWAHNKKHFALFAYSHHFKTMEGTDVSLNPVTGDLLGPTIALTATILHWILLKEVFVTA